jgi:hypothetical protein
MAEKYSDLASGRAGLNSSPTGPRRMLMRKDFTASAHWVKVCGSLMSVLDVELQVFDLTLDRVEGLVHR